MTQFSVQALPTCTRSPEVPAPSMLPSYVHLCRKPSATDSPTPAIHPPPNAASPRSPGRHSPIPHMGIPSQRDSRPYSVLPGATPRPPASSATPPVPPLELGLQRLSIQGHFSSKRHLLRQILPGTSTYPLSRQARYPGLTLRTLHPVLSRVPWLPLKWKQPIRTD